MQRKCIQILLWTMSFSAFSLTGCGPKQPDTGRVIGKVIVDGQPVPNLQVVFNVPGGRPSYAVVDEAGNFKAELNDSVEGVRLGTATIAFNPLSWDGMARPEISKKIPRGYFQDFMTKVIVKGTNEINLDIKSTEPAPSLPAEEKNLQAMPKPEKN